jgi:hypothetical protein
MRPEETCKLWSKIVSVENSVSARYSKINELIKSFLTDCQGLTLCFRPSIQPSLNTSVAGIRLVSSFSHDRRIWKRRSGIIEVMFR